jgi:hypothetical protein
MPARAHARACDHNPTGAVRTMPAYFQFDIRNVTDMLCPCGKSSLKRRV